MHLRETVDLPNQPVIRMNVDTIYSSLVLDLSKPVEITLPEIDGRYQSMHVMNQEHYSFVEAKPGTYRLSEEEVGTRFAALAFRTFIEPNDPEDVQAAHAAQDGIVVSGGGSGPFEAPDWDTEQLAVARKALNDLAAELGFDSSLAFGRKDEVDPVQFLVGGIAGWAGLPARGAIYLVDAVDQNDGQMSYAVTARTYRWTRSGRSRYTTRTVSWSPTSWAGTTTTMSAPNRTTTARSPSISAAAMMAVLTASPSHRDGATRSACISLAKRFSTAAGASLNSSSSTSFEKERNMTAKTTLSAIGVIALGLHLPACAQEESPTESVAAAPAQIQANAQDQEAKRPYSPYVDQGFPQRPLFGDTHLHTSQSFDAVPFGTNIGPEQAYRFARGEEVTSSTGVRGRLSRPLDFLVVADHAESLGVMGAVKDGLPELMADPMVRGWHQNMQDGGEAAMKPYYDLLKMAQEGKAAPEVMANKELSQSFWEENNAAAEKYNDPGQFTAFIGYEWSSNGGGNNLHRVVIYKDDSSKANQMLPFSSVISENPEDLWTWMANYQESTGGQVLAIPHNGNLSNGRMYSDVQYDGSPITREWAETRAAFEPLIEATQIKGDGETHPFLSPNDEFADYETWDQGNLDLSVPKTKDMLAYEYARSALQLGLKLDQDLGANPYKFGMIGSTDAHTGMAAVAEDNFFGKLPKTEPSAERMNRDILKFGDLRYRAVDATASGYAAVWATENTREAIFEAMQRRETYATTGPRMTVRLFGSWDFEEEDANTRRLAQLGYSKGVPMGGDLSAAPGGKAPMFLVAALKDALGANLDRYQIVKGWLDSNGKVHEKVYDVAWGGDRKPGPDGKLPAVGNTVDVGKATYLNSIGASELTEVWQDPDFDPDQPAFYYGRVIEIPTPRWTAYDAAYFKSELENDVQMMTQERAYTSPIWYTPEM